MVVVNSYHCCDLLGFTFNANKRSFHVIIIGQHWDEVSRLSVTREFSTLLFCLCTYINDRSQRIKTSINWQFVINCDLYFISSLWTLSRSCWFCYVGVSIVRKDPFKNTFTSLRVALMVLDMWKALNPNGPPLGASIIYFQTPSQNKQKSVNAMLIVQM